MRSHGAAVLLLATAPHAQEPTASAPVPNALSALNPSLTVIGNFTGRLDDREVRNDLGDPVDDRFQLREVEVDLRASIDPWAEGVFILALGSEAPGEYEATVEEGYVDFVAIPGLEDSPFAPQLRAGRFRPRFGRMNSLHTHDLPQTTRPLAFRTFLGDEGYVSDGVSLRAAIPTPGDSNALDVDVALHNGGDVPPGELNDGNDPALTARAGWFVDAGEGHALELGASTWFGRADPDGVADAHLFGADATYTWFPLEEGQWHSVVVGGEVYYGEIEDPAGGTSTPFGGFVYGQYQLDHDWFVGTRFDYTEDLADDTSELRQVCVYATTYTSELLRLRASWERTFGDDPARDGLDTLWLELNFVFGAHPPHPYWVHR